MELFDLPPIPAMAPGDQVVLLRNVSWEQYVALSGNRTSSRPLMAYLDGELEIVTTSAEHELDKKLIARFVEAYAEHAGLELNGVGNATFRDKAKQAGLEPDECYSIGRMDRFPSLAIDVVYTSGGIDKLEIYRRLGVAEVWFWIARKLYVYRLVGGKYEPRATSGEQPGLDLPGLQAAILGCDPWHQTTAVRAYRQSLRTAQ